MGWPAKVLNAADSGVFTGYDTRLKNGPHLATFVIDGAFAGGWVNELTFTALLMVDQTYV